MQVYHFSEVDSTNVRALALWRKHRGPLVVTAATQTAGVGRSGRPWLSPAGGLWMTIAWPFIPAHEALPLVIGLATRDAIAAQTGLAARIKWPNDVLIAEKKVAGVLCRAEVASPGDSVLLIGVGINANFPGSALPTDLRQPATTLLDQTGQLLDLPQLASGVTTEIQSALESLQCHGLTPLLMRIRRHLAWLGQPVTCSTAEGQILSAGIFRGIDDSGAALIELAGELHPITIGELHFSRQP